MADPAAVIVLPIDVVQLVGAVFTGLTAVLAAGGGVFAIIAAARAKRAELASLENKRTIELVERNTNSLTTQIAAAARLAGLAEGIVRGKQHGIDAAAQLAEGQRQGRDDERASVAASNPHPESELQPGKKPIDVEDDRTATAAERSADAQERTADATEAKVK